MKEKMIYFVCRGKKNEIIKITKQRKRAEDMMTELGICVHSYNPKFYPDVETLKVCKNAHIRSLSLSNVIHQNSTDRPITFFLNEGEIDRLYMYNVDTSDDLLLDNRGRIDKITEL